MNFIWLALPYDWPKPCNYILICMEIALHQTPENDYYDITSVKMALIYEINQWAIASHSTHYDFGYVKFWPKDGA